jgi:hypothetical protein
MNLSRFSGVYISLLLFPCIALAQIPRTISYQGVLTDTAGTAKPDANYSFTFRLYNAATGGVAIWSEVKSLKTGRGLFSTILGDVTPFPDSIRFDRQYWLGIQLPSEPELLPRIQITSVGSSMRAVRADIAQTVPDNSLQEVKFADGQVVKSVNGIRDRIRLVGGAGTSVVSQGDSITISGGGTGGGIAALSNTDSTLRITNPGGPTVGINMHYPLLLAGNVGVGVTPTARFHVAGGTSWFQGDSTPLTGSAGKGVAVGFTGELGYVFAFDYGTFTPKNLLLNNPGGRVAIGTTNPFGGTLHVTGSSSNAIYGITNSGTGVSGVTDNGTGVVGYTSSGGWGVSGSSVSSLGVYGQSYAASSAGVYGVSAYIGVEGISNGTDANRQAIRGDNAGSATGYAGLFYGNTWVAGTLIKNAGAFRIDHPLDPANKFLQHSFVESPDMKNIYDGIVTTDAHGEAAVALPDWFEALNYEFRYQLTTIGQFAQAMISREISGNSFTIRTDKPLVKVSWQVTGIRHDAYAVKNPIQVESMKLPEDRGRYLAPTALGLSGDLLLNAMKPQKVEDQTAAIRPDPPASAGTADGVRK